ncbi:MAG TPA: DUF2934 domain-containing protein [Burkholderiales bacterium]|nr:DUF2934 domain-containing protein [Burkholderiales bacterium]
MAVKKGNTAPPDRPKARKVEPFTGNARAQMSAEELKKLVAEAAYHRAKERGFAPGYELQDWIEAEAEVMVRIGRSP